MVHRRLKMIQLMTLPVSVAQIHIQHLKFPHFILLLEVTGPMCFLHLKNLCTPPHEAKTTQERHSGFDNAAVVPFGAWRSSGPLSKLTCDPHPPTHTFPVQFAEFVFEN